MASHCKYSYSSAANVLYYFLKDNGMKIIGIPISILYEDFQTFV